MLPQRERERLVLESHNCEVKQRFGSTWRNMHCGEIFNEQFALLMSDITKSYCITIVLIILSSNKTTLCAGCSLSLFGLWLHKFKGMA